MSAEAAFALTTVSISTDDALLRGDLVVPAGALGIVFAHGSGRLHGAGSPADGRAWPP
jgi:hypothetical protein